MAFISAEAENTSQMCEKAYRLLKAGKPSQAVEIYQKVLGLEARNYTAQIGLARAYDAAGMYRESSQAYEKAIRLDPMRVEAYDEGAAVYDKLGNLKRSIELQEIGLKIYDKQAPDNETKKFKITRINKRQINKVEDYCRLQLWVINNEGPATGLNAAELSQAKADYLGETWLLMEELDRRGHSSQSVQDADGIVSLFQDIDEIQRKTSSISWGDASLLTYAIRMPVLRNASRGDFEELAGNKMKLDDGQHMVFNGADGIYYKAWRSGNKYSVDRIFHKDCDTSTFMQAPLFERLGLKTKVVVLAGHVILGVEVPSGGAVYLETRSDLGQVYYSRKEVKDKYGYILDEFWLGENPKTKAYVYSNIGAEFLEKNDLKNAIKMFDKSLELDPLNEKTYWRRAEAYKGLGMDEKADQDDEIAKELARRKGLDLFYR